MIELSIVIPTFNRAEWLAELLESISLQTYPLDRFEVIIVDDGSSDDTALVADREYAFRLAYFHQQNQGDAHARNLGAAQSGSDFLLFLDDDIILDKHFLARITQTQGGVHKRIVVGRDILWLDPANPLSVPAAVPAAALIDALVIPFADVCSNNMMLRKKAYFDLGMMEALDFPGSSIWCDVDFSFRAFKQGFEFLRSEGAFCWHRDYVMLSLENQVKRMDEVAFRAVSLINRYPELVVHLPMFTDKVPVDRKHDSPAVIFRKQLRSISASRPVLAILEKLYPVLKDHAAAHRIKKWIIGAYIYRGFQRGLSSK